ncbi:MAG: DUF1499 domain-containing protein [Proteobacteria bacterium]|nr:DUF1499 domain-containing protein [Pseudomonadota bacterium]
MNQTNAWSIPLLLTAILIILGPLLAHLHMVAPIVGFLTFAVSLVPGLIAVFFGIYLLYHGHQQRGLMSLLIGLVPLAVIAFALVQSRDKPRINDISTNLDSPPSLTAAAKAADNDGKDLSYPETFKSQVQAGYPDLISLQVNQPPSAAFALVQKVAAKMPDWKVSRSDDQTMTLEGEETAGLFQFTDDIVIRVLPMAGGAQIDMRSRSRVGKGDFGANAKRIRAFFAAVQLANQPS